MANCCNSCINLVTFQKDLFLYELLGCATNVYIHLVVNEWHACLAFCGCQERDMINHKHSHVNAIRYQERLCHGATVLT